MIVNFNADKNSCRIQFRMLHSQLQFNPLNHYRGRINTDFARWLNRHHHHHHLSRVPFPWYCSSWTTVAPHHQSFKWYPLVTIPVAPMNTAKTKHFMFHIRLTSALKRVLYFNLFLASSCIPFLDDGTSPFIKANYYYYYYYYYIRRHSV